MSNQIPPKPSEKAIKESLTTINLSINPNLWLSQRLQRIQKNSKIQNKLILQTYDKQELNVKINELREKMENEFEKILKRQINFKCEWIRYFDEENKLCYFYNINTNQVKWKLDSKTTKWIDWSEYNKKQREIELPTGRRKRYRVTCIYNENTMKYVFRNEDTGNIITQKPKCML